MLDLKMSPHTPVHNAAGEVPSGDPHQPNVDKDSVRPIRNQGLWTLIARPRRPAPSREAGSAIMRAIRICTVGGIVGGVAFGVSQITSGLVGGAAFILALYIVPVTVGLALAVGVEAWTNRPRSSGMAPVHARRRRLTPTAARVRCSECGQRMTRLEYVWVCASCDGVMVER